MPAATTPPLPHGPGTPKAEVAIDAALVRALLDEQHPDLATLALTLVDEGWDNVTWRLGEDLAVRVPRRAAAADLIEREQAWLPSVASRLPLAVPAPVRRGKPTDGYPWPWSILPWIEGATADLEEPRVEEGGALANFLCALHQPAPPDAPRNPVRGVPLANRRAMVEERAARVEKAGVLDTRALTPIWREALATPIDMADTWIHGDLHARNVLVSRGRLTGVLDWGDMAAGDRATDLAAIWGLLPSRESRAQAMRACVGVSEATWMRARGWAYAFGMMLLDSGMVDHPRHAAMGRNTLLRLIEGP